MDIKKWMPIMVVILFINTMSPAVSFAESLDDLQAQEEQTKTREAELNQSITKALDTINEKYTEIENLKQEIAAAEATIQESEVEISTTEQSIERRKEVMSQRMQELQLNGDQWGWQMLLEAENFSDFFNRAYMMTLLQSSEKEKVERLAEDKDKIVVLQETVKAKQSELQENEAKLQSEANAMDDEVTALKTQLADNEELLQSIISSKEFEEARLAEQAKAEKEQQEKAQAEARAQQAASSSTSASSETTENSTTSTTPPSSNNNQTTEDSSSGNIIGGETTNNAAVFYMESTAYSYSEPGSGYITAIGIDLRQQSNVIAVDPSVIKLGSLVKVEGYGYAIAGDTGGAIKGNIIDVHFPTVAQCTAWGRRHNVRVEVQ